MILELTEEQQMMREMARSFAEREVRPVAAELDETGRFPVELVRKMAELGLMGVAVPEEHGGAGMDNLSYAIAMEEVCRACASTGVIMSVNNSLVCDPILTFGTAEQKAQWLVPLAQGRLLGCFALSEPGTGSDAAAQTCMIRPDGDHYVVNGTKNWITNGPEADVCVLIGMQEPAKGVRGITSLIVDMKTPGVSVGKHENKMGIRGSGTSSIMFDDARFPRSALLGKEGDGFRVAMNTLDGGRIGIAAQALGIARAACEDAVRYATERKAFGGPIADLQAIQHKIADMATEIDAARLLVWRAAALKDQAKKDGRTKFGKEAAMAKLFASEMSHRVCHQALQIHGGYGYVKEYAVERYYRDQRITELYEGTSEIQRLVIARAVIKEIAG
ncbi:MAG: acyl-CoA dehydrogenase [Myxococcales bacterium]